MDTAERIFKLLDQSGMEQKQFAELIGASDKVVSKWRTAGLKSYRKYLPQIATVLNTTVEYLLTGQKEKSAAEIGSGLDEQTTRLMDKLTQMSSEDLELLEAQIDVMLKRRQEK